MQCSSDLPRLPWPRRASRYRATPTYAYCADGKFTTGGVYKEYGSPIKDEDIVTLVFNRGTLSFKLNGVDQGVATTEQVDGNLYLIVGDMSEGDVDLTFVSFKRT